MVTGSLWSVVVPNGLNAIFGLAAGALVLVAVTFVQRLRAAAPTETSWMRRTRGLYTRGDDLAGKHGLFDLQQG